MRAVAFALAVLSAAGPGLARGAASKLELRGKVLDSAARFRFLRVTLFKVESPFTASTLTDPAGEFRFRDLMEGSYTVSIVRRGLGEVRRSVVVSPSLADQKGVVRVTIPFSAAEAAAGRTGGVVSQKQLTVPDRARGKYAEADRKLAKLDPEGAVHLLEEAVKIAPQYTAAWNALGVIAFQSRDVDKAEGYFRRALEIEPDAFEAVVNMGGVLIAKRLPKESLVYNLKAVQARPKDPLANSQCGRAYFEMGKFDEAAGYLETAERLDPAHYSQPQLFLAEIYFRRGDRAAAVHQLEDLLERRPDGPMAENLRRSLRRMQRAAPLSP